MHRSLIIIFFFLINSIFLFNQESKIISSARDRMLSNINAVNSLRARLLETGNDATDDLLKIKDLEKAYFYNEKKIMYKEMKVDDDINLNIALIHMNNINLTAISQHKIYISELHLIKGKVYYFIGCKNASKSVLLLFTLTNDFDINESFSLVNSKGEVFFSNNSNPEKLQGYIKKINDPKTETSYFTQNNITKFKFFPNHEIYYFIEN